MRRLVRILVPALFLAAPVQAQPLTQVGAMPSTSWHGSLLGGETVAAGDSVVSADVGWPSISAGFTRGLGGDVDAGVRIDLLNRLEQTASGPWGSSSKLGVGVRIPLRLTAARTGRFSVLLHMDPGFKLYTEGTDYYGLQLPVGATFGYQATPSLTVAFGVDLPITVFLYPGPVTEWVAPSVGPGIELRVGSRMAIGLNTRVGAVLRSGLPGFSSNAGGSSGSEFGFLAQLLLAYGV